MTNVPYSNVPKKPASNKKVWTITIIVAAAIIAAACFGVSTMVGGYERGHANLIDSMQKSMASHGVNVDKATAERVSAQCMQNTDNSYPSVSIVADFRGVRSIVTMMCESRYAISDLAAAPAVK